VRAGAPLRVAAALALSGRYAPFGRQAAAGIRSWAEARGARLRIEDDRSEPAESARLVASLAPGADVLLGPYGSGPGRAVARAMAGRDEVLWNHGAAEVPGARGRWVDVLAPAGSYWRGLPHVLGPGERVAVVRAPGVYGGAIAAGAVRALEAAGRPPVAVAVLEADRPEAAARWARGIGATTVAGGGRAEDDLALARELSRAGIAAALVVCGVDLVRVELGDAVLGWTGPVQWDGTPPPLPLPADAEYPGAQALAACLVAEQALALAGTAEPGALWTAARSLRATTFLGPFAVDGEGRQTAHAPSLVRWVAGPAGPRREVVWRPHGGRVADSDA
jgi:substrate-binding family protein